MITLRDLIKTTLGEQKFDLTVMETIPDKSFKAIYHREVKFQNIVTGSEVPKQYLDSYVTEISAHKDSEENSILWVDAEY
jgi:hypothetical protein